MLKNGSLPSEWFSADLGDFEDKWCYYRCRGCNAFFVTLQIDDGGTPDEMNCKSGCGDKMFANRQPRSLWPVTVRQEPDAEWYRPGPNILVIIKRRYPKLYQHIKNGGLILRAPE